MIVVRRVAVAPGATAVNVSRAIRRLGVLRASAPVHGAIAAAGQTTTAERRPPRKRSAVARGAGGGAGAGPATGVGSGSGAALSPPRSSVQPSVKRVVASEVSTRNENRAGSAASAGTATV